jgi:hypothetical protein
MGVVNLRGPRQPGGEPPVDSGGGPPHDGHMEERVKKLEDQISKAIERVVNIERDMAVVRSNYATKEDLHKELHATTWKVIAAIAALCGAVFWMARNVEPPHTPAQVPAAVTTPASAAPAK